MADLTEGRHTAEFILSEANGNRSRENGTVKSGEDLAAGTVLELDSTKLVAFAGGSVVGILIEATDASSADVPAAYLARDAEVNLHTLTYPDTTASPESDTVDGLADLGIIARS